MHTRGFTVRPGIGAGRRGRSGVRVGSNRVLTSASCVVGAPGQARMAVRPVPRTDREPTPARLDGLREVPRSCPRI